MERVRLGLGNIHYVFRYAVGSLCLKVLAGVAYTKPPLLSLYQRFAQPEGR